MPHGGQLEFIREIERDGAFVVISGAGNGWGKSEILAAIFASIMWPSLAPATMAGLGRNWPHPKRARIYSSPAELEKIGSLQTAIARLFPKGRYVASNGKYGYPSVFVTDTGWVMDMFSYERAEGEAAGPNIGLQGFNEPPPEPLYKEAAARARAGGIIVGGFTSLLENVWVADGILGRANGEDIRVRYGNSCENCIEHGINGTLKHEQIMRVLNQFDPDEREARFTGKPLTFSGAIFKGFDRKYHVAPQVIVPPSEGVEHFQVVDPAIGKPLAVIWAYVDASGALTIYDEHPEGNFEGMKDSGWGVAEYVAMFKAREKFPVSTRILDRHFGNVRRTMGGLTLKQEFAEAGIGFIDSYNMDEEVETGILKVKDYLRFDKSKPIDSINRPRLIVSPNCTNTIKAMERWSRNPKTGKPQEEFKDFADVVRYLVMSEPRIEPNRDWGSRKIVTWGVGHA